MSMVMKRNRRQHRGFDHSVTEILTNPKVPSGLKSSVTSVTGERITPDHEHASIQSGLSAALRAGP